MITILQGDWIEQLHTLPDKSVQCCVTSPPYWGLRDYGTAQWEGGDPNCDHKNGRPGAGRADGIVDETFQRNRDGAGAMGGDCKKCGATRTDRQLGLEKTPEEYVAKLIVGFREVKRVLRDDGTLWLNLGDSYSTGSGGNGTTSQKQISNNGTLIEPRGLCPGMKTKDLVGIPWMVAFSLRADGWYLRSDIIWHKPNPMPESVTDRPTKAHEYIFLLSKSERYYYDAEAIKEPVSESMLKQIVEGYNGESTKDFFGAMAQDASGTKSRIIEGYRKRLDREGQNSRMHVSRDANHKSEWNGKTRTTDEQGATRRLLMNAKEARENGMPHDAPFGLTRNKRSVWTVTTASVKEAHFATFPPELITPCILAGSKPGDTVLDPFFGSGTTGMVALELGRKCIGIELNPEYVKIAEGRTNLTPGLPI